MTLTRDPETNSKFAPKNGWLEYDPFLLGFGLFSGAMLDYRSLSLWMFQKGNLSIEVPCSIPAKG